MQKKSIIVLTLVGLVFISGLSFFAFKTQAAISHVQAPAAIQGHNVTSQGITFPVQPAAGNLVVVGTGSWKGGTAATISSVTDNCGNAYTVAKSITPTTSTRLALYYAKNITTCVNFRVTVTYSSMVNASMAIDEYSGVDTANPLDATNSAIGNSTTATSGSTTAANANSLYVGFMLYDGNDTTITPVSGWTQRQEIQSNQEQAINLSDKIASGA